MKRKSIYAALAGVIALTGLAVAQQFPARPITMVIPFAAGGPTDVLGRVVAARMTDVVGQQVVVENVGGAGGMLGGDRVARGAADGYQMLLGTVGTQAQGQTLYKKPLYNSVTDFKPVALLAQVPIALVVKADLPVKDLKEFIAYAQTNQKKMQFGSAGPGSATHLGCVLLNYVLKLDITHIPYKGTGPAMQDLIGGNIDYLCEIITTAKPQVDGGKVKAIALMNATRSPALPNLPTAKEQGTDGLEAYTWNALFVHKDTPDAIVAALNKAAIESVQSPGVKDRLEGLGAQIVTKENSTPEYLGKLLKEEIAKWAPVIKASGVSID